MSLEGSFAGTKAPKEVTRFCGNVRFSEQLLCVLECTIGWELLFSKHSDCLYTMAGDQGLCFTVSWAVSMFWLIHGCFYTSKSSSIVQAFTGENNYEAKVSLRVAPVTWSFSLFPLWVLPRVQLWVCSQHDQGSLGQRDTSDRRPQWLCPNLPFLRNLLPHKFSLSQSQDYFLCCLHPSALPTPVVSAAVTSFSLSCVASAQATFNCYFFHLPLKNSTYIIFLCG